MPFRFVAWPDGRFVVFEEPRERCGNNRKLREKQDLIPKCFPVMSVDFSNFYKARK